MSGFFFWWICAAGPIAMLLRRNHFQMTKLDVGFLLVLSLLGPVTGLFVTAYLIGDLFNAHE